MSVCVIINARLGSTRVPKKMGKPFWNSTLLDIALQKLEKSKVINPNDVYVSLYDEELKNIVRKYKFNIFDRTKESAEEEFNLKKIYEWWDKLDYETYFLAWIMLNLINFLWVIINNC